MLSLLFIEAITWASRKLISLIDHNTACTTLIQWNIPMGAKWHRVFRFAPGSGQNGSIPYFFIFSISHLKNIIIFAYISWLNTCIAIVWRFLPNIMILGWILLTWDQFFLSYAILPGLPLYEFGICIVAVTTIKQATITVFKWSGTQCYTGDPGPGTVLRIQNGMPWHGNAFYTTGLFNGNPRGNPPMTSHREITPTGLSGLSG